MLTFNLLNTARYTNGILSASSPRNMINCGHESYLTAKMTDVIVWPSS
jgi:hypothetical protein